MTLFILSLVFFTLGIHLFIPRIKHFISPNKKKHPTLHGLSEKHLEIVKDAERTYHLDANYKKLILSVLSFKDRIAREVMVPRIDVFSLASDTAVEEAAKSFLSEGYSRIP